MTDMAGDSATSLGYSAASHHPGWGRSALTAAPTYLSLVEVVGNSGTLNPYLVIANEELVSTRFLFVFDQHTQPSVNASALVREMKLLPFDVNALHAHATTPTSAPKAP